MTILDNLVGEPGAAASLAARSRAVLLPVRRRLQSRRLQIVTPIGWTALLAAAGLFVVSRFTGWQECSAAAVALVAAFLIASLFVIGHSKYVVVLDLRTKRVQVGEQAVALMVVRNAAGRRLLPVRMELPVGSIVESIPVPSLRRGQEYEEPFRIPTARRSVIDVGPARSVRGDAFGLLRRVVRWTEPEPLYVHPRTVHLLGVNPGFLRDLEGQPSGVVTSSDIAFHAIREYVPGDDRRYIHWNSTARRGKLMVRQFEETRRSHIAVVVPLLASEYAKDEEFETAVSVAASVCLHAFQDHRPVSLIAGAGVLDAPTSIRLLDGISAVQHSDSPSGSSVNSARTASTAVPSASIAFLICGALVGPAEIRRAGTSFPLGTRVVVIQVDQAAPMTVRTIGTLPVVRIGELDDLAKGLRAVLR